MATEPNLNAPLIKVVLIIYSGSKCEYLSFWIVSEVLESQCSLTQISILILLILKSQK